MKKCYIFRKLRSYPLLLIVALFLAWHSVPLSAQNATISPELGNLITAYTHNPLEVGFQAGYGSLWQHKQLPISYSCSEEAVISPDGMLGNHTCNFVYYKNKLVHCTGVSSNYSAIALPKGYKITGYKIVIRDNLKMPNDRKILDDVFPATLHFGRDIDWEFGEVDRSAILQGQTNKKPVYRPGEKVIIPRNKPGQTYTIQRQAPDMGNIIYFCFSGNMSHGHLAAFTYESIELTFTAHDAFEYKLEQTLENETKVSLADNDFELGKTDVGKLEKHTKAGKTFYSYDQYKGRSMTASVKLYQEGAHDGKTWKAENGQKTIRQVISAGKKWYALDNATYYVEAPTKASVFSETGESQIDVGYRIVGVKVDYKQGQFKSPGFTFTTRFVGHDYYLDENCEWQMGRKVIWHRTMNDELFTVKNGKPLYMFCDQDAAASDKSITLTLDNKHVKFLWEDGKPYFWDRHKQKCFLRGTLHKKALFSNSAFHGGYAFPKQGELDDYQPSTGYKLTVYGPTGELSDPLTQTKTITMGSLDGTIRIGKFNNDAVKIKVESLSPSNPATALVNISVFMENLNPYISSVDVVCEGKDNTEQVRTFEATNFELGGEKFIYRVPVGFSDKTKLQFTFRNLKSNFADETYLNNPGTHNSRYSFVASEYYDAVNDDLYGHKDIVANYDYEKKVKVALAGNIAFPFNNAADLANTSVGKQSNYFTQRQFTMAAYKKMTGEVVTEIGGVKHSHFEKGKFVKENAQLQDNETKTMYLYTTDETRYNIAPTTKEQHRAFAYYHTVIKLKIANYKAKVKWHSIYNKPMYYKDAANKHYESTQMVGAEIQTTESGFEGNKHQVGATSKYGYLTLKQIIDVMKESIAKGTDPNVPKSLNEVLYVDNSNLFDIIRENSSQKLKPMMEDLRSKLSKNALIFLPYRAAILSDIENVAVQRTDGNGFDGYSNITLTDKVPFFTPYKVQLKPNAYATYTRDVTAQGKGRVKYATVVLPYGLTLDGSAMHSNAVGPQSKFYLAKMKSNALKFKSDKKHEGADYDVVAKFDYLTGVPKSEANVPYIVMVAEGYGDGNVSFVATEKGALIEKTPTTQTGVVGSYEVQSKLDNSPVKFKSYYTYSGRVLNKAGNDMVFYFSLDRFVAFKNLKKSQLFLFPFRTFFHFENQGLYLAKSLNSFEISFDGDEEATPTDIDDVQEKVVLKVTVSTGQITAEATKNVPLTIYTVSGQCAARAMIKAGETRTFYLSPGVYLVNGKKMIVN